MGHVTQRSPPRQRRVLYLEHPVGISVRGARARLHEALLEVVREEGVEDGVHGAVGVGEAARE